MRNLGSLVTVVVLSCAAVGCATAGEDIEYSVDEAEAGRAGKFTLSQSTDGQFRFRLEAGNGAVLLASEAYATRTSAINGILSVQTNGVDSLRYEVAPATHGFVVHLRAGNGQIIGTSEPYATSASAARGVSSTVTAVVTYLDQRETTTTGARVEVVAGATGQFHWSFFGGNGEAVLSSESYTTEAAAYNGALAVQSSGQRAGNYDVKLNAAGGYYFTIQAANGEIVGVSRAYPTRAGADAGVAALIALLPVITVI
jgi:uncharacterized protein